MKIAIGADHGGFALKTQLIEYLKNKNYELSDEGTYSVESCDYPVFAKKVAGKVASGECDLGVLVCTSGIGMSIAANKVKGARAALVRDASDAEMSRRHNNANVICFGAKATSFEKAAECLDIFLNTKFDGGRHIRRVNMFED